MSHRAAHPVGDTANPIASQATRGSGRKLRGALSLSPLHPPPCLSWEDGAFLNGIGLGRTALEWNAVAREATRSGAKREACCTLRTLAPTSRSVAVTPPDRCIGNPSQAGEVYSGGTRAMDQDMAQDRIQQRYPDFRHCQRRRGKSPDSPHDIVYPRRATTGVLPASPAFAPYRACPHARRRS